MVCTAVSASENHNAALFAGWAARQAIEMAS